MRELNDTTSPLGSRGGDEVQADATMGPVGHCRTSQFRSVVAPQHRRLAAPLASEAVQFGDQVLAGDAALDYSAEAFAGVSAMS